MNDTQNRPKEVRARNVILMKFTPFQMKNPASQRKGLWEDTLKFQVNFQFNIIGNVMTAMTVRINDEIRRSNLIQGVLGFHKQSEDPHFP